MPTAPRTDYGLLDHPQVLAFLFHPRSGYGGSTASASTHDLLIPVAQDAAIGARFHMTDQAAPSLLFFHGNGEIVDDYDDLGPVYNRMDINFLAFDYRGYGNSSGRPTVSAMMQDCHRLFDFTHHWLEHNGYGGALVLMGRSLGSASVLELASQYPEQIAGLIIESGFAYTVPLLQLIGIDVDSLGFTEEQGVNNLKKIETVAKPTLIIHAEQDHIIPCSDGQALYDASPAADKRLLVIPHANHNNIMATGFSEYMQAIKTLVAKLAATDTGFPPARE